jgi:hypothetical protein
MVACRVICQTLRHDFQTALLALVQLVDGAAITATDEEFLFWQHLLAASLISNIKPVSDLTFGEGQPEFGEGGARIMGWLSSEAHFYSTPIGAHALLMNGESSGSLSGFPSLAIPCNQIASIDRKRMTANLVSVR